MIGSALDILEYCGTPRTVYTDLPLGHPVGKPYDSAMQGQIIDVALDTLVSADAPGHVTTTSVAWADDETWKTTFMRLDNKDPAELLRMGDENRAQRKKNRELGLVR